MQGLNLLKEQKDYLRVLGFIWLEECEQLSRAV